MSDSQAQAPPTPYGESDIRAQLRADSLTFPAAYEEYPWGQVVIKVNKKVFLFLDGDQSAAGLHFSVKLPISGADVLSLAEYTNDPL
ncbi:MAG: MmcQ/YjbR family DNA-binding protein [Roseiflexaceae bacterium]